MMYAKWKLKHDSDGKYGFGPEQAIAQSDGWCESCLSLTSEVFDSYIIGYVSDDVNTSLYVDWEMTILNTQEFLALAKTVNTDYKLDENEKLVFAPEIPTN